MHITTRTGSIKDNGAAFNINRTLQSLIRKGTSCMHYALSQSHLTTICCFVTIYNGDTYLFNLITQNTTGCACTYSRIKSTLPDLAWNSKDNIFVTAFMIGHQNCSWVITILTIIILLQILFIVEFKTCETQVVKINKYIDLCIKLFLLF